MEVWIGPAIVAAVISSIFGAIGWYATYRTTLELDRTRRREKARDIQIALRAEIRIELSDLEKQETETLLEAVRQRYREREDYAVFVPSPGRHVVYEHFLSDIHILPEDVIDPVVLYYRQRDTIERLVEDFHEIVVPSGDRTRQLEVYEDYLRLRGQLRHFAWAAFDAIGKRVNNPDEVRSGPKSDAADSREPVSASPS